MLSSVITACVFLELIAIIMGEEAVEVLGKDKVCSGTNYGYDYPTNIWEHYFYLKQRYTNCTIVDGNLELTHLKEPDLDYSFLEHITEVTGYVSIYNFSVSNLVLPRLKFIRGRKLFPDKDIVQSRALIVQHTFVTSLELPALRYILNGTVAFFSSKRLCYVQSIDWAEIITAPYGARCAVYFGQSPSNCPKCHESCEKGCWGAGPENCQKFNKIKCAAECSGERCFGSAPHKCCHPSCAGGCVGPTQFDCIPCKNFDDDENCKKLHNPSQQRYDASKLSPEDYPYDRWLTYGASCFRKCPKPLLAENGTCVQSCQYGKETIDGECPSICQRSDSFIHSGNIDAYEGCNIILGSISIKNESFLGGQDSVHMHPERLEVFSDVTEITGYLYVEGHDSIFENLSFFRNLEVIHGREKFQPYNSSLIIVDTSLKSLELKNLTSINAGGVRIVNNSHLCYVDRIAWLRLKNFTDNDIFIEGNMNKLNCESRENKIVENEVRFEINCPLNTYDDAGICRNCHDACDGCEGPEYTIGPKGCKSCSFGYVEKSASSKRCLLKNENCPDGYYRGKINCLQCHPECKGCNGPDSGDCIACRNYKFSRYDSSAVFNCTSKCPAPFVKYDTLHGHYCASRSVKHAASGNKSSVAITVAVPLTVMLCAIIVFFA